MATIAACATLLDQGGDHRRMHHIVWSGRAASGHLAFIVSQITGRRHRQFLDTLAYGLFGLAWSGLAHAFGSCLSQGVAIADFRIWSSPCLLKLACAGRRHRQFSDTLAYGLVWSGLV